MGGLLTLAAGGFLKGVGDGMIEDAKAKREAALEAAKEQSAREVAAMRAKSTTDAATIRGKTDMDVGAAHDKTTMDKTILDNQTSSDNNKRNNDTSRANNSATNSTSSANNAATNATSRANNQDNNSEKTNPKPLTQNQALETARQTYKDNLTAGIPMKDDNGDDIPADEWIADYADRLVSRSSAANPTPITGKISTPTPYVPTNVSGPVGGGLLAPSGPAAPPASIVAPASPTPLQVPSTVIRYDQNGQRIQ